MGNLCMRCCRACCSRLARLTYKDGDTEEDRELKDLSCPCIAAAGFLAIFAFMLSGMAFHGIHMASHLFLSVASFLTLFVMRFTRVATRTALELYLLSCLVPIICSDWVAAAYPAVRYWGFVMILVDGALVAEARPLVPLAMIWAITIWLITERAEAVWLYGLYSWGLYDKPNDGICTCPDPPCALTFGGSLVEFVPILFIFLSDFYLTRGFAVGMRQQFDMVQASVAVCGQVASLLARYEVDKAAALVDGQGDSLPPEMRDAFGALLGNLRTYRPYLPQSCLPVPEGDNASESPGAAPLPRQTTEMSCGTDQGEDFGRVHSSITDVSTTSTSVRSPRGFGSLSRPSRRSMAQNFTHAANGPLHGRSISVSGSGSPRGSMASSQCGPSAAAVAPAGVGAKSAVPRSAQVTLLCANRRGFLSAPELQHATRLQEWSNAAIGCFVASSAKGVIDLVNGDHYFASFGASRPCLARRTAAAFSARKFIDSVSGHDKCGSPRVYCSIASGSAVCGDFGTDSLMRFMVVGGISSQLQAMDRVAPELTTGILCDGTTHADIEARWICRLMGKASYRKRGTGAFMLWDVLKPKEDRNTEWMYAMTQDDPWDVYNKAVHLWYLAGSGEHLSAQLHEAAQSEDAAVRAAVTELTKQIEDFGEGALQCVITETQLCFHRAAEHPPDPAVVMAV
eukprot:TRINITY_DN7002_c0_g1_i3.p1 TRINITY_DN7002_c0_g1~~TRINITY_DN7002_c0_g1_i3.p1  ORF type:complete len:682 (+),score=164.47 TRINITY_DN7002_c0_g1_i3:1790-3835(+)